MQDCSKTRLVPLRRSVSRSRWLALVLALGCGEAVDYLKAICPEPSQPNFFLQKPDGSVDGTHFQKSGAPKLASFVADGLRAGMVGWIKE